MSFIGLGRDALIKSSQIFDTRSSNMISIMFKYCDRSDHKHWSFLVSDREASGAGLRRPSVRPSHIQLTMWLPMALRTSVSSRGKSSRSRERTLDRWVPRFLWIPEHSMQMRAPRFRLAHVGSGEEQKVAPNVWDDSADDTVCAASRGSIWGVQRSNKGSFSW